MTQEQAMKWLIANDAVEAEYVRRHVVELELKIAAMEAEATECGFMFAWHEKDKPTLAIRPGAANIVKQIYGL